MSQSADTTAPIADKARQFAPVVWLVGKVQSGKTSIIRALTQATDAEIGAGFRACTRTARVFDFPDEAPIIRFLDTRGLGEAGYDPAADIAFCEGRAHLILAVVKALDSEQHAAARRYCAKHGSATRTGPSWWRKRACMKAIRPEPDTRSPIPLQPLPTATPCPSR